MWFALAPVGVNSVLMVLGAVVWNNLSGHRYPHVQPAVRPPEQKAGIAREDLDAALDGYGETLDVSRDDLASILADTEQRAAERRARQQTCGAATRPLPARARRATVLLFGRDTAPTVGSLVAMEFVALRDNAPLAALLARFHDGAQQVYVVDGEGRLTGIVRPRDLLAGLGGEVLEAAA